MKFDLPLASTHLRRNETVDPTGIAADDGQYFACEGNIPVALVEVEAEEARVVRGFNL